MRRSVLALAVVVAASGSAAAAFAAEKLAPGQEGKLEIPGCTFPCVIYVPTDYQAGSRLPAIFYLHPMGSKPSTSPFRHVVEGKGYFVVGLSYGTHPTGAAGEDGFVADLRNPLPEFLAMVTFIERVRTIVDDTYGIDQNRVFLAGYSMGGWAAGYYGFNRRARGRYRGYCMIAAGPLRGPGVDFTVARGLPVLLLNGEKDASLEAPNDDKPMLENAGAIVTQVVVPGEGHGISEAKCAAVRAWLNGIADADQRAEAAGEAIFAGLKVRACILEAGALRDRTVPLAATLNTLDAIAAGAGEKAAEAGKLAQSTRAWAKRRAEALKTLAATQPAEAAAQLADFLPRVAGLPEEWHLAGLQKSLTDDESIRTLMQIRKDFDAVRRGAAAKPPGQAGAESGKDQASGQIAGRLETLIAEGKLSDAAKAEAQALLKEAR